MENGAGGSPGVVKLHADTHTHTSSSVNWTPGDPTIPGWSHSQLWMRHPYMFPRYVMLVKVDVASLYNGLLAWEKKPKSIIAS